MVREKHPCFHRYLAVSGERGTVTPDGAPLAVASPLEYVRVWPEIPLLVLREELVMSSLSEQPPAVTGGPGGPLAARTSRFGGLDPAAPLPRISISRYPGALKGSFFAAHPGPAWAPRNGEKKQKGQ